MKSAVSGSHRSFLIEIALLLVLAILSQLTVFTTTIDLKVSNETATLLVDSTRVTLPFPDVNYSGISAVFGPTMSANPALTALTVKVNGEDLYNGDALVPFVFGRALKPPLAQADWGAVKPSFGDWTQDRHISNQIKVFDGAMSGEFEIHATFVGRGEKRLVLNGANPLVINNRDGYIDNDYSVCNAQGCLIVERLNEDTATNLTRIANLFIEALLLGVILKLLARALSFLPGPSSHLPALRPFYPLALAVIALSHLGICIWFGSAILGGIPHIPDSAVYYRQAILLAAGMLGAPLPAIDPVTPLLSNGAINLGGFFSYHYPHFWAGMLAPFVKLGIAPLGLPIFSTINLLLISELARRYLGTAAALITAILFAYSPFTILMAGDYLTHQGALLLFLSAIWCVEKIRLGGTGFWFLLAGMLAGYMCGVRLVTAIVCIGAFMAFLLIKAPHRVFVPKLGLSLIGFGLMMILVLLDNQYLTGSYFESPYQKYHHLSISVENLNLGANWTDSTLGFLAPMMSGFPFVFLVLGLAAVPIFGAWRKEFVLLYGVFTGLVAAHLFFNNYGLHGYGSRLLFEGMPGLFGAAALGVILIWRLQHSIASKAIVLLLAVYCLVSAAFHMHRTFPKYRDYNDISTSLYRKVKELDPATTVLVASDWNWFRMDTAATLFDPSFKGLVVLSDRALTNLEPFRAYFSGRSFLKIGDDSVTVINDAKKDNPHSS